MNLDLYLTTAELARLLCYPQRGVKRPNVEAARWARARGIHPGDGGRTKLWPKDDVIAAIHRGSRIGRRRA